MKHLHVISSIVLALTMSVPSYSQDVRTLLDKVKSDAEKAFVTVEYSASVNSSEGSDKDSGVIEAQDDMWHLKGEYLEIYTDAEGTWILDNNAKEVYVEPVWTYDDLMTFYDSILSAGSSVDIRIVSTKVSEKKPSASFTPSFSSDWVITDMR